MQSLQSILNIKFFTGGTSQIILTYRRNEDLNMFKLFLNLEDVRDRRMS